MNRPLVSINLVVYNGESFIRFCLDSVFRQSYSNIEVNVYDNASTDQSLQIVSSEYPRCNIFRGEKNIGMWPGQESLFRSSKGEYVMAISVDVILDQYCIQRAVTVFNLGSGIGAVQSKTKQWRLEKGKPVLTEIIDTIGFRLTRARRLINEGHGQLDDGRYNVRKIIFGAEGACPIFRREALESATVDGHFTDPDYFWYGDDFDLAWRLTLFGWRQMYDPGVVAYHQRSTTTEVASTFGDHFRRLGIRKKIPLAKRRLDWSNTRFTIIKNDYMINLVRDLPYILIREFIVFLYTLFFEPQILFEGARFLRLLPRMLHRRRLVMSNARVTSEYIRSFFIKATL